jgi:hypothetical protein
MKIYRRKFLSINENGAGPEEDLGKDGMNL